MLSANLYQLLGDGAAIGPALDFSHALVNNSTVLSSWPSLPGPMLHNQKQAISLYAVLILQPTFKS